MTSVTLKEIAQKAGVSKSAISHVLNNRADFVSKETRERILKIIEETNYRPNYLARSLATKKTNTIGVLMPSLRKETVNSKIEAVTNICWSNGYDVVINCSRGNDDTEEKYLQEFVNRNVEGAIVVSPTHIMQDVSFIQKMIDGGFPLVFIDRVTGVEGSYVQVDRYKGGKIAAEHLANLGYESVLYLKTSETNFREQDRFSGFIDAWEAAGHDRLSVKVIENSSKSDRTKKAINEVLLRKDRPTALFGYDEHVLMAVNVARGIGIHVPDDLAVVGFDNLNLTADFDPPLTTVDYPKAKIGEYAFNVLMRLIQDPKHSPIQRSVEPFLVVRESCGASR